MAKRKRKTNKITNKRRQKEGRGEGILGGYKPWIHIQDVASKGLATRIKGLKTGRVHHLLSQLELHCFYCLDWDDRVFDIREQYPLDLPETLAIAEQLNIRHPRVPVTLDDVVMTTDFLVTVHHAYEPKEFAFTVKYSNDLENPRTIEKLEIERFYWARRGVEWSIITEKQIKPALVKNIKWVHPFANPQRFSSGITPLVGEKIGRFMYEIISHSDAALRVVTAASDKEFSLPNGTSLAIARHLIAVKKWAVDMRQPIQPQKSLRLLNKQLMEVFG